MSACWPRDRSASSARASPRPADSGSRAAWPSRWVRPGFVVVSGLARGIDAAAHAGALETGTVAVLGGGVDDIYPPDNADLYAQIVERGCVVSESPMGARAQARDFPRRNRIISGLSRGRDRGRGGNPLRLADHRPAGGRTGPRRLRRAGLAAGPALEGTERTAASGGHPVRGAGGRAAGLRRPCGPCANRGDPTRSTACPTIWTTP